MGPGAQRLREAAQARGPLDPNAPDYVPPEDYPEGGVLDRMGPGGKRLSDLGDKPTEEDEAEQAYQDEEERLQRKYPGYGDYDPEYRFPEEDWRDYPNQPEKWQINRLPGSDKPNPSVERPIDLGGGHKPPVGPDIRDLITKPAINVLPGPITGGHIPVPLPEGPKGHVPGHEVQLPNVTDVGQGLGDLGEGIGNWWEQRPGWLGGAGADSNAPPSVPAEPGHPDMSSADVIALLEELLARLQAPRSGMGTGQATADPEEPEPGTPEWYQWMRQRGLIGPQSSGVYSADPNEPEDVTSPEFQKRMGAGLQLGPIHLNTSMRPPMRMPSSRMEMGRRAGWTPRTGGIARRPSMGTSAMLKV